MASEEDPLFDYAVQDVALVDRNTVVVTGLGPFVGEEPNVRGSSRVVSFNLKVGDWGALNYDFGERWRVGAGLTKDGKRQALFGAYNRIGMLNYADGPNDDEPGRLRSPATLACIALIGDHFYAAGGNEFLGRRDGPGEWAYLSLAASPDESRFSFYKIAGNAEDNIYLLPDSELYTVCHWNGESLRPIPTSEDLQHDGRPIVASSLAVSPDGQVFVGGSRGQLLIGTADTGFLPLLYPQKTGVDNPRKLHGLAWYNGSLWAVDGSQLLRLVDGAWEAQPVFVSGARSWGFDYIYSGDGALLIGSQFHAVLYNGTEWRKVFGHSNVDELQQLQLLQQQHDDMAELLESARALRDMVKSQR